MSRTFTKKFFLRRAQMSIALTAKVEELEQRLTAALLTMEDMCKAITALAERLEVLEQTAQRKPGPKPKDAA